MATAAASVSGATAIPYVGWIIGLAAAYVDAAYLYPELIGGEGKQKARPPRLLDVPIGSNEAGAPRIWAIGARVRVPTHILWQDEKVRETQSSAPKGGTAVPLRRVYIDALVSLNDRLTQRLIHLIGNGKLMLFSTRNIVTVTTDQMSAAYDAGGPHIEVAMVSTQEPSFVSYFVEGDIVTPRGFVRVSGPSVFNDTYWRVSAIADHTPGTPSSLQLVPMDGQAMTGLDYTGGSVFSPASVERVDDAIVDECSSIISLPTPSGTQMVFTRSTGGTTKWDEKVDVGAEVLVRDIKIHPTASVSGGSPGDPIDDTIVWTVLFVGETQLTLQGTPSGFPFNPGGGALQWVSESSTDTAKIQYANPPRFTAGIFPSDFDPDSHYFDGSESQGENTLLATDKGSGNIPAYRGVAYQGLPNLFATQFGDQLPYSLEALIQPDAALTIGQAAAFTMMRGGIPEGAINVDGLPTRPFGGMFLRGAVPTLTAMQPMLVAYQIVGQDRDGVQCLFTIDNADAVQVENGANFSDFSARVAGEEAKDDKVVVEDQAEEDLPTSIGIRHQDPDNQFADGYQHFGLRNPGGVDHQNEQEVDLSNLVLTRKEARNLATTMMRRAWINRRTYRFMLPPAYLDLLENDLVTFTTDTNDVVRCRVIQRDVGADFRVSVTAIAEDVNLEVEGSPVQSAAGAPVPTVLPPALMRVAIVDAPATSNSELAGPALKLAVCAEGGGANWAGCSIYESVNGASYQFVGTIGNQAVVGTLELDLTAQTASESYGTTTVTVRVQETDVEFAYEGDTPLEAATQAEAEAGKNWCAIVDSSGDVEIAAFTTVVPLGDRVYTLGGWLRGLRGTNPKLQATGSTLVMLHPNGGNTMLRTYPGSITPASVSFKVVPLGKGIDDVSAVTITPEWRNVLPLPVRSVSKTIGASPFDARFTVDAHWTRLVEPLGTQPPHPMDEPFEAYRFDIYDPTGATLLRQKTITAQNSGSNTLRDKWVDYPASEQTTDGYTPSASETFWIDVVQLGQYGESPSIKQEL